VNTEQEKKKRKRCMRVRTTERCR